MEITEKFNDTIINNNFIMNFRRNGDRNVVKSLMKVTTNGYKIPLVEINRLIG